MAGDEPPLLLADSIELSFEGRRILNGFALRAYAGEITGLLGRNGCGKSSLLKIIFGALNPAYKHIRINGKVTDKPYRQGLVAYLPQKNFLPGHLTVARAAGLYGAEAVAGICAGFGMQKEQRIDRLSGGQRRMAETLLILHSKAPVILLDEPFSHITPVHVEQLFPLIRKAAKDKVIIVTDHLYIHLLEIADKIMLMHNGSHYPVKDRADLVRYGYLHI